MALGRDGTVVAARKQAAALHYAQIHEPTCRPHLAESVWELSELRPWRFRQLVPSLSDHCAVLRNFSNDPNVIRSGR